MKRDYWETVADHYEAEIFDVCAHDRKGLVLSALDRYGAAGGVASDLGCGIGSFLPALSERFRRVTAVDISSRCIAKAKARCAHLPNVDYLTMDLAAPRARLPKADVALSCNSIITPILKHRNHMLDVVCRQLQLQGHLVLVVPSLESALLTHVRLIEWNLREGLSTGAAVRAGFQKNRGTLARRIHEGVVQIDGVATKHFLEEELIVLLKNRGMSIRDIQKIAYQWETEFTAPPRWMKDPFPWDWLCVAQKVK